MMSGYLRIALFFIVSVLKSRRRLGAENLVLRHQVMALRRRYRVRIRLTGADRAVLSWVSRLVPAIREVIVIVRSETLMRWRWLGFRTFWRWKSRRFGGPLPIDREIKRLILQMAAENSLWGHIHGELMTLGIEVAQSTVSNPLRRHPRPRGQIWKTFIANHMDALVAIDLFVVPPSASTFSMASSLCI